MTSVPRLTTRIWQKMSIRSQQTLNRSSLGSHSDTTNEFIIKQGNANLKSRKHYLKNQENKLQIKETLT